MAREKFSIKTKPDARLAKAWLEKKLADFYFPFSSKETNAINKNSVAKRTYEQIDDKPVSLNEWCEAYLNNDQWILLKGSIRAGRLRKERKKNSEKNIKRIDVSPRARYLLKELSKHYGVTYSELIEKHLEAPYMDVKRKVKKG